MKLLLSRLFLLAGLTAAFGSCSKDKSEDNAAGITCTIDGTEMTFNVNSFALRNDGGGNFSYACYGTSDVSASPGAFVVTVAGESAITPGTYTFDETSGNEIKMGTLAYLPAGSTTEGFMSVPGSSTTPTKVIVTAVSDKSIQGTFEGDIIMLNGTAATVKTVKNGRFNVTVMQ